MNRQPSLRPSLPRAGGWVLLLLLSACTTPPMQGPPVMPDPQNQSGMDLRPPVDRGPGLRSNPIRGDVAERAGEIPHRLSMTGLYENIEKRALRKGVYSFRPTYELWSDGAEKTRYFSLPEGTRINTAKMDRWVFPVGTKLWKEFRRGGKLLETRIQWKVAEIDPDNPDPRAWVMTTYIWNDEENEAYRSDAGMENAKGTGHEIPRDVDCKVCHDVLLERPLGLEAIQLSYGPYGQGMRLRDLINANLVTHPPANTEGFVVPGNESEKKVLGYLHGNCGGCHAKDGAAQLNTDMQLRLVTDKLTTVVGTPTYTTTLNILTQSNKAGQRGLMARVKPGNAMESAIYFRMGIRFKHPESLQMPPEGSLLVDETARASVAAWINSLKP